LRIGILYIYIFKQKERINGNLNRLIQINL
jgi:hypothetical protein